MKKRVIPSILLGQGTSCVISSKFKPWRTIGTLVQQLKLHVSRDADELLILSPFAKLYSNERTISLITREVDIPIAYAGNVSCVDEARYYVSNGFEKLFLTSLYYDSPNSIIDIVNLLGSQSVSVSLPYTYVQKGDLHEAHLWDYRTRSHLPQPLIDAIKTATTLGVGEILLHNVDLDGSLSGLDIRLFSQLQHHDIHIPILVGGGAGSDHHFYEALSHESIAGVVAGSIFSLTESTPKTVREYCSIRDIKMRRA